MNDQNPFIFGGIESQHVIDANPPADPLSEALNFRSEQRHLVKYLGGKLTRTFKNFHQPTITEKDYAGARAIVRQPSQTGRGRRARQIERGAFRSEP